MVYREPKKAAEYQLVMDRYYNSVFNNDEKETGCNGAILMGVCRGRISEGLDFSDNAARCVIIVGIPFPQMVDPKVILKKEYLDEKIIRERRRIAAEKSLIGKDKINIGSSKPFLQQLSGKDWYN